MIFLVLGIAFFLVFVALAFRDLWHSTDRYDR